MVNTPEPAHVFRNELLLEGAQQDCSIQCDVKVKHFIAREPAHVF